MDWIKKHWARMVGALAFIVVITLVVILWISPTSSDERNEAMRTILTAIGAAALLLQLRYTHETTRATTRTLQVTERGNEHDLFFRATEQLGNQSEEARIGALFSLESLSRDSDNYYEQVIQVIMSFIRRNTHLGLGNLPKSRVEPPHDVQTAVTIIGRRRKTYKRGSSQHLEFSYLDLRDFDFNGGNFRGAHFNLSWLDGATFINADLAGALFHKAHLKNAVLAAAKLQWAKLVNADLSGARFFAPQVAAGEMKALQSNPFMRDWFDELAFMADGIDGSQEVADIDYCESLRGCDFGGSITIGTQFKATCLTHVKNLTQDQLTQAVTDDKTMLPNGL